MYCPKCGKKNDEDAKFCAFCGEEILDTQPEEVTPAEFVKNRAEIFLRGDARQGGAAAKGFLMRHRKAAAVCVAAAVLLIGGISAVRTLFNPERSARSFFESYMQGDWEAVYQEIYLPEAPMLDEAHFLKAAGDWAAAEYLDYQVEPFGQTGEDSLYLRYRFTYSTPGSTNSSQMEVTLVRTGKTALFFDTYKVALDGLVAEDCTVTIPEGAVLLLDGEALETETAADGAWQLCRLPQMFAGTYTLGIQHPVYRCADTVEYVGSGMSFDLTGKCTVEASALRDPAYGDVTEYLSAVFAAALDGGTLEGTGIPVSESQGASAADNFRDFQENCESNVSRRGEFQLTEQELEEVYLDAGAGTVDCDFSYECLRQGKDPGDSPTTFSGSAEMEVAFQDGTWQLVSFRVFNIY